MELNYAAKLITVCGGQTRNPDLVTNPTEDAAQS
jgi:hypothetical protein